MGRGRLDVTLQSSPLQVWFDAYVDFLIRYQPFHFAAEAGVSIGIECVVDFCIASTTISASLGVTLYLQGPPKTRDDKADEHNSVRRRWGGSEQNIFAKPMRMTYRLKSAVEIKIYRDSVETVPLASAETGHNEEGDD
ncbi:hypothetical protein ONZ43_g1967 [Nemania bipapillata]|uniref:Uncharacterized protein n=1 Tax=Nemania bipapillata TaxID=110536 RepID=A0ACC2J2L5_9PEZI|nr:hypothetical protein ONZ43_g1967 [Nemania bipapillata]